MPTLGGAAEVAATLLRGVARAPGAAEVPTPTVATAKAAAAVLLACTVRRRVVAVARATHPIELLRSAAK